MSYFVSKIGHLDPRLYSLIYCAIPGVQMSGVQMSDFISKIGHLYPRFYSLIYCDTGGPDVGGPDVGGPDVGGPDVGGPDVGGPNVGGPDSGVQMSDSHNNLYRVRKQYFIT